MALVGLVVLIVALCAATTLADGPVSSGDYPCPQRCDCAPRIDHIESLEAVLRWLQLECSDVSNFDVPPSWDLRVVAAGQKCRTVRDDLAVAYGIDLGLVGLTLAVLSHAPYGTVDPVVMGNISSFYLRRATQDAGGVELRALGQNFSYQGTVFSTTAELYHGYFFSTIAPQLEYDLEPSRSIRFPVGPPTLFATVLANIGVVESALFSGSTEPSSSSGSFSLLWADPQFQRRLATGLGPEIPAASVTVADIAATLVNGLYGTIQSMAIGVHDAEREYVFYAEVPAFSPHLELGEATVLTEHPQPDVERRSYVGQGLAAMHAHPSLTARDNTDAPAPAPFVPGPLAKRPTRTHTHSSTFSHSSTATLTATRSRTPTATLNFSDVAVVSQLALRALNALINNVASAPGWPADVIAKIAEVENNTDGAMHAVCRLMRQHELGYIPKGLRVYGDGLTMEPTGGFDIRTQFIALAAVGRELGLACSDDMLPFRLWNATVHAAYADGGLARNLHDNSTDPATTYWAVISARELHHKALPKEEEPLRRGINELLHGVGIVNHQCVVENSTVSGLVIAAWAVPAEELGCEFGLASLEATLLEYFAVNAVNPFRMPPPSTAAPPTSAPPTETNTSVPATTAPTASPPTPAPTSGPETLTPHPTSEPTSAPNTTEPTASPPSPNTTALPTPTPSSGSNGEQSSSGIITGAAVGGIVGVCLVMATGLFIWSRIRARKDSRGMEAPTENLGFY